MTIAQGTKLGQYEVQDYIGQGAMGLVYRAYHSQLERTGAVKVLQAMSPDRDTTARFKHEAQAIAQMRHPNIVNVYDFGEYQGTPYMIVEYVPGGNLAARMAQGPLDEMAGLKYLRGIAAGLDYAHAHGVVHRDVKPANVLLTAEDAPVLADFGLAKLLQGSSLKSMTGVTTGTPAYMAPEQVTGSKVGPAADRYSLATIAYEMLTGVIPFDGEALMELLYAQVHREPPAPSARNPTLTPAVDAVIMRGLAKDPNARWESCTAMVDALAGALHGEAVPAPAAARTMAMSAVVGSTLPLGAAPAVGVGAAQAPPTMTPARPVTDGTVALPYPVPSAANGGPAGTTHVARSRGRLFTVIGAATLVLVLLLTLGICAAVNQPTLTLTPTSVVAGGTVLVNATHVPANQVGEIQLLSQTYYFAFRADDGGNVTREIVVPSTIDPGGHTVRICWNGTCHKQASIVVLSRGVASATPTANSTPGAPTAGSTPAAGSTPTPASTAQPTSTPHSTPGPTPRSSPTPTAKPTPTKPPPSITVTPTTVHILTSRDITVSGLYWPPGSTVSITFIQLSVVSKQIGGQNVQSNGAFSWSGGIPSQALPGSATVHVCSGTVCVNASITVAT